ncbi:MAG: hypothetical protein Q7R96_01875 [Nanoarchaeota archaeon]|nr:hypothetical protein [Nanoarchaeota archaeon]
MSKDIYKWGVITAIRYGLDNTYALVDVEKFSDFDTTEQQSATIYVPYVYNKKGDHHRANGPLAQLRVGDTARFKLRSGSPWYRDEPVVGTSLYCMAIHHGDGWGWDDNYKRYNEKEVLDPETFQGRINNPEKEPSKIFNFTGYTHPGLLVPYYRDSITMRVAERKNMFLWIEGKDDKGKCDDLHWASHVQRYDLCITLPKNLQIQERVTVVGNHVVTVEELTKAHEGDLNLQAVIARYQEEDARIHKILPFKGTHARNQALATLLFIHDALRQNQPLTALEHIIDNLCKHFTQPPLPEENYTRGILPQ